MKRRTKMIAGAVLAVILSFGCAALLFFAGVRAIFAHGGSFLSASSESAPASVLNQELLSLLDSDNSTLKQSCSGRCYAELMQRGTFRLTYFSPYLSIQFAPAGGSGSEWPEGYSDGFYDENPLADNLVIRRIDFCEEIDPKTPSPTEQPSLRQLIQTTEPITYTLLCEILQQTPELVHRKNVYYDAGYILDDPEARNEEGQRIHRAEQRVIGGADIAVFLVDDVKITVSFIPSEEEELAFYAKVEKGEK